jgi:hypothetical protein
MPIRVSRRDFLKLSGGAVLAAVVGGGVWRAADQGVFSLGQGPAYEAWNDWMTGGPPRSLALVKAAILAANADNSQAWLFRVGEAQIDLFADAERHLLAVDPYKRNIYISLGCALENLLLAAPVKGYAAQLMLTPEAADAGPAHVARIVLVPGETAASNLYRAIPLRHMNRGAYDTTRPVSAETLASLKALGQDIAEVTVFWFTTEDEKHTVSDMLIRATEATIADAGQSADIARWTHSTWQEIQQRKDGITLEAAGLSPAVLAAAKMLPPMSAEQTNQAWLKNTREVHVKTAAAFGVIAVRDRQDRTQQINGGRLFERMHLWATGRGLALHMMHQAVDRAGREESLGLEPQFGNGLQALLGDPAWHAQSMFRLGYPTAEALRSPRRSVKEVLLP